MTYRCRKGFPLQERSGGVFAHRVPLPTTHDPRPTTHEDRSPQPGCCWARRRRRRSSISQVSAAVLDFLAPATRQPRSSEEIDWRDRVSPPVSRILCGQARDDHLSGTCVATGLMRSTWSTAGGKPSSCLTLLRVGFAKPSRSPAMLVVSYTTVSPLPAA